MSRPDISSPRFQPSTERRVGYGKSFSSFGEIVQGRTSDGEDFLVTLPVDLWSICELVCTPIRGPLVIECDLPKSRATVEWALEELGLTHGFHINVRIQSNIPVGKGLSSSTADMLAALRALQEVFGFLYTNQYISKLFRRIEPHDALQYNNCVVYNHREGRLLFDLQYIPSFSVISVDNGGILDTVAYNRNKVFRPNDLSSFDCLRTDLIAAFNQADDVAIARCATRSAELHAAMTHNEFLKTCLSFAQSFDALGVQATHSGTCTGFLFSGTMRSDQIASIAEQLRQLTGKEVFTTRTLNLLR